MSNIKKKPVKLLHIILDKYVPENGVNPTMFKFHEFDPDLDQMENWVQRKQSEALDFNFARKLHIQWSEEERQMREEEEEREKIKQDAEKDEEEQMRRMDEYENERMEELFSDIPHFSEERIDVMAEKTEAELKRVQMMDLALKDTETLYLKWYQKETERIEALIASKHVGKKPDSSLMSDKTKEYFKQKRKEGKMRQKEKKWKEEKNQKKEEKTKKSKLN